LRGDRRETANDDSRRSRPAVDRLCRPKGGMNDQRFTAKASAVLRDFLENRNRYRQPRHCLPKMKCPH